MPVGVRTTLTVDYSPIALKKYGKLTIPKQYKRFNSELE